MTLSRKVSMMLLAAIVGIAGLEAVDEATGWRALGIVSPAEARVGRPLTPVSVAGVARPSWSHTWIMVASAMRSMRIVASRGTTPSATSAKWRGCGIPRTSQARAARQARIASEGANVLEG